jgi:hypothetical protein
MISKLIESFATEIQKEETQEYINNILDPYLCKYKYYLFLITFMFFVIMVSSLFNSYCLLKRINS